jgi:uncharacterized protein (DUF924 family)
VNVEQVLSFWFGELDEQGLAAPEFVRRWWVKDTAFDEEIRGRFGACHSAELARQAPASGARGRLASVIVLDQFSRNLFRNTGRMFAADAMALDVAAAALAAGDEAELRPHERTFLYMPFMHSEHIDSQDRCVSLFDGLLTSCSEVVRAKLESNLHYAKKHRDIILKFGRYPHRNALLGRESTAEELAFLETPGSSF